MAGESLNRPDESKLSSVRFLLSPLVVLCTPWRPAALSAATGAGGQGHSQLKTSNFYGYNTGSLFLSLHAPRYCLTASAGFGRQFTKLRALSRLRRRYDSRKNRILRSPSFPPSSFSCKHSLADIDNPRNFGYAIYVTKVLNYAIITNAYRKE